MSGTALPTSPAAQGTRAVLGQHRLVRLAGRHGLTTIGPIAVSGAHFAASLIFLHKLAPWEFGLFSFLLVVVPFCLSISSGLLGAPLLSAIGKSETLAEAKRAAFREVNRFYCLAAGVVTAVLMYFGKAGMTSSILLGVYGAAMTFRWFARYNAYNANAPLRVAASDFVYSAVLLSGLAGLILAGGLSLDRTSMVLVASAVLGLLPFGWTFLKSQFRRPAPGFFEVYTPVWRDITRWSLMGVVASEMTANAHAYLVTLISGTHAFALLALGTLMMRPLSLVLGALPDRERPAIASRLAAGDTKAALKTIVEFRIVAAAMWIANAALAVAVLVWLPGLIVRDGFDARSVVEVVALWALIIAVRAVRSPEAAFLTAAGEFRPLARAGLWGSSLSLGGTLVLLVFFDPVVSLFGIVAGETAMTIRVMALMASWRRVHA